MVNTEELEALKMALGTLEGYGAVVIAEYARWSIINGLESALLGAAIILAAWRAPTPEVSGKPLHDMSAELRGIAFLAKYGAALFGAVFIANSFTHLFAPEAEAIRMLLRTVGG